MVQKFYVIDQPKITSKIIATSSTPGPQIVSTSDTVDNSADIQKMCDQIKNQGALTNWISLQVRKKLAEALNLIRMGQSLSKEPRSVPSKQLAPNKKMVKQRGPVKRAKRKHL